MSGFKSVLERVELHGFLLKKMSLYFHQLKKKKKKTHCATCSILLGIATCEKLECMGGLPFVWLHLLLYFYLNFLQPKVVTALFSYSLNSIITPLHLRRGIVKESKDSNLRGCPIYYV